MDKRLIIWLGKSNLVDDVLKMRKGNDILVEIGRRVVSGHESDLETMAEWTDILKTGMDLIKPDNKAKDFPWEGASNYKSTVAAEAVRNFGDRYATQILGKPKLVAGSIEGDDARQKQDIIDRVTNHMNYQINTENKYWRDEQKSLGYQLAAQGTIFKKTWFDPACGFNVSEVISHPYFSVNNDCQSLSETDRFTQIKHYTPNDVFERVQSGTWTEFDLPTIENYEDKDQYKFLEQMCHYDLDDDGYEEPYLITVHMQSSEVVRIVPRWNESGIIIDHNGATISYSELQDRLDSTEQSQLQERAEFVEFMDDKRTKANKNATLISIKPVDILTKYGFVNPADGTLLSHGFCHIMTSGIKGINKATNSLFNAGDLSNLQGGFLSKEHRRKRKGPLSFKPGMWMQTNIDSNSLANSVINLPVKEPSQALFNLNEGLKIEMKEVGTKVNLDEMMSPNIPAMSVLGILQEGSIPTSALMDNMVNAMSHEFQIMFNLNKEFTDPITYQRVNDGKGDYEQDYNSEIIIKPTANAKFSSQQQSIQMAQVQLEQIPLILQVGANPIPIVKNFFDAIESDLTEAIFSDEIPPEEQKQLDAMKQLQEQQTAAAQKQADFLETQTALMHKEQELNEREILIKAQQKDEELRLQAKKQEDDFAIKLTELEQKYQANLDASVKAHKDLQLSYDQLNSSIVSKQ